MQTSLLSEINLTVNGLHCTLFRLLRLLILLIINSLYFKIYVFPLTSVVRVLFDFLDPSESEELLLALDLIRADLLVGNLVDVDRGGGEVDVPLLQ